MIEDNHTIGCNLEAYAGILRARGFYLEARSLEEVASHIK